MNTGDDRIRKKQFATTYTKKTGVTIRPLTIRWIANDVELAEAMAQRFNSTTINASSILKVAGHIGLKELQKALTNDKTPDKHNARSMLLSLIDQIS